MRFGAVWFLLSYCCPFRAFAASAPPTERTVTLILRYDQRASSVSTNALSVELSSVMKRAHVDLDLLTTSNLGSDVQRLVVFQMHGYCGMDGPVTRITKAKALGSTSTSDGRLLPFVRVDCDEIRNSLASLIGSGNPQEHQIVYGQAVAKVMAHELYHVLARSADHTHSGITRSALSATDLSNPGLAFSNEARDAIQDGIGR